MRVGMWSLVAIVVAAFLGAAIAGWTGPDVDELEAAAELFVPADAEVVDRSVDEPSLSPVARAQVRLAFVSSEPPDVGQVATDGGWRFVADDTFRRDGIQVAVTGAVPGGADQVVEVVAERSADTMTVRIGLGGLLGAVLGIVAVLLVVLVRRRR